MSKKKEGAAPSVIVEAILLAVNASKTVMMGLRPTLRAVPVRGNGQSTTVSHSSSLPRRSPVTQAGKLKKQVQDRGDWCECGNKSDLAYRISIEHTLVSDRMHITDHHFSIWYCDDCEGIVDVIAN